MNIAEILRGCPEGGYLKSKAETYALDEAREYVEAEDEWAMSMRDYEK